MSYPPGPPSYPPPQQWGGGDPQGGWSPPPPPQPPEKPSTIRQAVALMWAGAALSIIGGLIGLLMQDQLRDEVERQLESQGQSANALDPDTVVTLAVVAGLIGATIGATLWIVHAIAIGKGRQWARITGSVLFAISAIFFLISLAQPSTGLSSGLGVLQQLISVGAVVLIWLRPSSEYVAATERVRRGY